MGDCIGDAIREFSKELKMLKKEASEEEITHAISLVEWAKDEALKVQPNTNTMAFGIVLGLLLS